MSVTIKGIRVDKEHYALFVLHVWFFFKWLSIIKRLTAKYLVRNEVALNLASKITPLKLQCSAVARKQNHGRRKSTVLSFLPRFICFYFSFTWNKKPPPTCQQYSCLLMWRAQCRNWGSSPPPGLPQGPTPTCCLLETSYSWHPVCNEVGSRHWREARSQSAWIRTANSLELVLCCILKTIWLSLH